MYILLATRQRTTSHSLGIDDRDSFANIREPLMSVYETVKLPIILWSSRFGRDISMKPPPPNAFKRASIWRCIWCAYRQMAPMTLPCKPGLHMAAYLVSRPWSTTWADSKEGVGVFWVLSFWKCYYNGLLVLKQFWINNILFWDMSAIFFKL